MEEEILLNCLLILFMLTKKLSTYFSNNIALI